MRNIVSYRIESLISRTRMLVRYSETSYSVALYYPLNVSCIQFICMVIHMTLAPCTLSERQSSILSRLLQLFFPEEFEKSDANDQLKDNRDPEPRAPETTTRIQC